MTKRISLVVAATAALAVMAAPAFADKDKHWKQGGKGHGSSQAFVPPGLAKKPGNMPPGQYKKLDHNQRHYVDRHDHDRYDDRSYFRYGQVLPGQYVVINDYNRWRLPPPPNGQIYAQYDNGVYRVLRDTGTVLEAIGIVSDLLN